MEGRRHFLCGALCGELAGFCRGEQTFFVPVMRSKTKLAVVRVFGAALLLAFTALAQTAAPWPEADRLFHSDPHWLGADAAFSVDLGLGRVLWLFGDSFVASKPGQTRRQHGWRAIRSRSKPGTTHRQLPSTMTVSKPPRPQPARLSSGELSPWPRWLRYGPRGYRLLAGLALCCRGPRSAPAGKCTGARQAVSLRPLLSARKDCFRVADDAAPSRAEHGERQLNRRRTRKLDLGYVSVNRPGDRYPSDRQCPDHGCSQKPISGSMSRF